MRCITYLLVVLVYAWPTAAQEATFLVQRSAKELAVDGAVSSAAHAEMLTEIAKENFTTVELKLQLSLGSGLPADWSLVSSRLLGALAATDSANASITGNSVMISGFTSDPAAWSTALTQLRRIADGWEIEDSVVAVSANQSFVSLCRQVFAEALAARRIEYLPGNPSLGAAAFALLDELVQTAADCPDASIVVTGYGDRPNEAQGLARAKEVVDYMADRGIARERLDARGSAQASRRKVRFQVNFR